MIRRFKMISAPIALIALMFFSSCFTYTTTVGSGPKSGVEVKKSNTYFLFGLIAGNLADPKQMAGDASDYSVTNTQTFVDGLLRAITAGIYAPTTTIVKK